ncbi:SH3 domain-containing protein [Thioalkalivibrio sp. ALMg13-2]|uniref:SH3 domain-containing protein n=1 Tax=Thioalkalivibrio sp. ALMg13-2 TaxID=1158167 RepID=UPI000367DF12|nr:SH3 domain-containing protein [Thioalkalivibrio sp. ALMg13-2]
MFLLRLPSAPVLFLLLLALYVVLEVAFNGVLVQYAGGDALSPERLHHIELLGRTLAGFGFALLLAETASRWLAVRALSVRLGAYLMIFLVGWSVMFLGQKVAIERILIEPSTAEERQRAHFTQLLRAALASNTVEIEGLDLGEDAMQTPAAKTFLTIFGGLVFADARLVETLEGQRLPILRQHLRQAVADDFETYWEEYQTFVTDVRTNYRRYADAAQSYHDRVESSDSEVARYRETMETEIQSGWQEYQQGVQAFNGRVRARADEAAPVVYRYFQRMERCGERAFCARTARRQYDGDMARIDLDQYEPRYWLIEEEVSAAENLGRSALAAVISGGASVAGQVLDRAGGGDGGWKDKRYHYTNDAAHYEKRIRPGMVGDFVRESGGYRPDITSIAEFRTHPTTSSRVRNRLEREGLDLPWDWTVADRAVFESAVDARVNADLRAEWDAQMRAEGLDAGPDLTFARFERLPEVQQAMREEMGEDYIEPMLTGWNREAFRLNVIEPGIERRVRDTITELEAETTLFGNGQVYEATGKDALRAVLVPPIAMVLSLLLVFLSLGKILVKGTDLLLTGDDEAPEWSAHHFALKAFLLVGLLLVVLFLLPFTLRAASEPLDPRSGPVGHLVANLDDAGSPWVAHATRWALNVQPAVLPVGLAINDSLHVYPGFSRASHLVAAWDDALMPVLLSSPSSLGGRSDHEIELGRVTAEALNVRSGPSADTRAVGVVTAGTSLEVLGDEPNGWLRIDYQGRERFVHGRYVSRP